MYAKNVKKESPQLRSGPAVKEEVIHVFRLVFTEGTSATNLKTSFLKVVSGEASFPCN